MHSVELFCKRPLGARYVICDEWHYKACLKKAADVAKAKAQTREFLGIAELNSCEWARDGDLVRRLIDRHSLASHRVRDRNPDTDGWWVINALLDEVRRGALLAIKGPRADLFPQVRSTPLTVFAAGVDDRSSGEPMRSGRYDPRAQQTRLTGDGNASTLLGDAPPFEYQSDIADGGSFDIAKTPNTGEPGTWYTNPGSGQMRLFGDDGKPVVDLDFDHFHNGLKPHAHNWNRGVRDGGYLVVPFSPWNP
jgi:hypothetical protein